MVEDDTVVDLSVTLDTKATCQACSLCSGGLQEHRCGCHRDNPGGEEGIQLIRAADGRSVHDEDVVATSVWTVSPKASSNRLFKSSISAEEKYIQGKTDIS